MERVLIRRISVGSVVCVAMAAAACTGSPESSCPTVETGELTGTMAHVRYLADDALEGRGVASVGERCAGEYIAQAFEDIGLEPAGEQGGWFQSFQVRTGSELTGPSVVALGGAEGEGDAISGALSDDAFRPYGFSGSGSVVAPLVYAGGGVTPTDENAPPLPDVEERIMVVEAVTEQVPAGSLYADPHFRANLAQGRGAAALVVLLGQGGELPALENEDKPFLRIPVVAVTGAAADELRAAAEAGEQATVETSVGPQRSTARNVVAQIPGTDLALADEVVVVGAHYDHLGYGGEGSLAPGTRAIHNGADDNASGTAALIEVAEALAESEPDRTVVFIAFSGEERGLLGSAHFVSEPTVSLEHAVAMINMDMVGRIRDNTVTVFGMATAPEWEALLVRTNDAQAEPFSLTLMPDGYGPSDHSSFYGAGMPVLHFFSNTHSEYHRPEDDWGTLNAEGLDRLVSLVAGVTGRVAGAGTAAEPARLTLVQTQPPAPSEEGSGRGYGPYFGSVPDMGFQDFGVRLNGVREGSPAANAGLQSGDVIVAFGGNEVGDLYAYTYALREFTPGDVVDVVIVRDGQRYNRQAVLGERR